MEMNIRKHAISLGSSYINRTVSLGRLESIQKYFKIDNSYLLRKLFLVVYPYKENIWLERTERDVQSVPIAYPDLYIPLVAIVTYVLSVAYELEIKEKFKPEELGKITTKSILLTLLEIFLIKGVSFFFSSTSLDILDIFSFTGYKYFTIVLMRICTGIFPIILSKLSSLFFILSFSIFLGRSLKHFLILEEYEIEVKKKKMYFLFSFVFLEFLLLLILK